MKIGESYWVWIDTRTGHIWNDLGFENRDSAKEWKDDTSLSGFEHEILKLKKIRIVDALRKQEEEG